MRTTAKCSQCREDFRKEELLRFIPIGGQTFRWYCPKCYEEKVSREKFSNKVCSIFGIKSPGPIIWTQRKRLREEYGYSDEALADCLDYLYNVEHKKKLSESLVLVTPMAMERMRKWKSQQNALSGSIAAAINNTKLEEHNVTIKENNSKKKEINLNDVL